jgi:hypothetical protein
MKVVAGIGFEPMRLKRERQILIAISRHGSMIYPWMELRR